MANKFAQNIHTHTHKYLYEVHELMCTPLWYAQLYLFSGLYTHNNMSLGSRIQKENENKNWRKTIQMQRK